MSILRLEITRLIVNLFLVAFFYLALFYITLSARYGTLYPMKDWQYFHSKLTCANGKPYSLLDSCLDARNASGSINDRFRVMIENYENSLSDHNWILLRGNEMVTVETLNSTNEWPFYIKTTAVFDAKPEVIFNKFSWAQFSSTQKLIDPFFENADTLLSLSYGVKVIKKISNVFWFPKREFRLAMGDSSQVRTITATVPGSLQRDGISPKIQIRRGALRQYFTTVDLCAHPIDAKHVAAYQDFVAWFVGTETGKTVVVIVMKVDLGNDIPRWLFTPTVGYTGVWALQRLISAVAAERT